MVGCAATKLETPTNRCFFSMKSSTVFFPRWNLSFKNLKSRRPCQQGWEEIRFYSQQSLGNGTVYILFSPCILLPSHYPTCCPAKISKRADHSRSFWTSPSSCNWVCCHVVDNSWALNLKQQRSHNKRKQRSHNKKPTAAKGLGCFLALWLIHLPGSFGDGVTGTMDFHIVWWKKITTKTGIIW